ncbi:MAG TPA: hypothetical protein PLE99_17275 [Candidatus Thiothrix moscowensis]|uniref:hypothetical protein n=1 Tax=unclassified Thiothrix TaxID=2636184 RepID=UPI0025CF8368|nr:MULTISPECIES: hypothetical protein [unclassified Thiothrix]HRJ54517.1 hypothetical protein [Candidatus Thiothrix moscowensis]HRJ94876.1 hypothetical protein [Candidatus Thiothrix moscowensis]
MKKRPRWFSLLLYLWVAPVSVLFAPLAWLAKWTGGGYNIHSGVLEIWGGAVGAWLDRGLPFLGPANAFTVGHVVVGISPQHLDSSRVHERTHVAQFERWGFLFPLVYLLAGLWVKWQGKRMYWDNPYEIEARAAATSANKRCD